MLYSLLKTRCILSRLTPRHTIIRSMSVKLDSAEAEFISHLDAFAATQQPTVTCRIAGGWVRDKVSQYPPHYMLV
jgi:hypothetical protein